MATAPAKNLSDSAEAEPPLLKGEAGQIKTCVKSLYKVIKRARTL
jgi:hypothetical protein